MESNMKRFLTMLALGMLAFQSSTSTVKAIDTSYAISMTTPASTDVLYANTSITIAGDVNWPFYKNDIDQVEVIVFDANTLAVKYYDSNAITNSYSSSCDYSTVVNTITSSGRYGVIIRASINNVVMNQKTYFVYVN